MVNDPVGDFIIQLKNAGMVSKESVSVPHSNLKQAIAETLKDAGFVGAVEKRGKNKVKKTLSVELLYKQDSSPRITNVKRISKPGRRIYKAVSDIHPIRYNKGALILSTPQGVMTGGAAKKANVGGEALFEIF